MNSGLTFETNLDLDRNKILVELSDRLEEYFSSKQYGTSINNLFIGVICVKPEFENMFSIRKSRYQKISKIKALDGSSKELRGVFSYDIKLNYEELMTASQETILKIATSEILKSLSSFDELSEKQLDFNVAQFKSDMKIFFG